MYVLLTLATLPALLSSPASPAEHSLVPAGCASHTDFLGFSGNYEAAAVRVQVTCRVAGGMDRLAFTQVVATRTGAVQGVFRAAVPERSVQGRLVPCAPATWARRYPAYHQALPLAAWRRVANAAHFAARQHDFADEVIRLAPIGRGLTHAHEHQHEVAVESLAGTGLHFAVVVRTLAGNLEQAAEVHLAASRAVLAAFYAHDGRRVALLVTPPGQPSRLVVAPAALSDPLDEPHKLGAVPIMQWDAQRAYSDFKDLLPSHDARAAELAVDAFRL